MKGNDVRMGQRKNCPFFVPKIVNKYLLLFKILTCKKTVIVVNLRMSEHEALQEIQALKAKIEELQKRLDKLNNTNPKKVPNE